ncbi:MAG: hypothetical protein EBR30_17835 [Cytophagia bacterium]|nr:hypothetical protein [Cytophagia bacterium]
MTFLTFTNMTFKYDNSNFSFETSEELKAGKPTSAEWDDQIIFEQEFKNNAKDITVTFRILDFSKQGSVKTPNVNDDKVFQIANEYINDIKMTGQVENIELPFKAEDSWIVYSAILKLSQDQKSNNVFYSKRLDNWILIISIGSAKTSTEELKILGQKIFSTLKVSA